MWSLGTREIIVAGPEAKVVCKTLLMLEQNFIKSKPIEEITCCVQGAGEREWKAFKMEMGGSQ